MHNDVLAELLLLQKLQMAQSRSRIPTRHVSIESRLTKSSRWGGGGGSLEVLGVLWLLEVLKIREIIDEFCAVVLLLEGEVIHVPWIGEALDELWRLLIVIVLVGLCLLTSNSSSKRVKPP